MEQITPQYPEQPSQQLQGPPPQLQSQQAQPPPPQILLEGALTTTTSAV